MLRPLALAVIAFACTLFATAAGAQMSQSDLLTRLDRLEATVRDLTGTVEQLQYRNQQLEQQVQHLQEQLPGGVKPQASAAPPQQPYTSPPPQYTPPPPTYTPAPPAAVVSAAPPAPVEQEPSSGRRGDAFDPTRNPDAPGAPRPLGASTAANEPPPVTDVPRQPGAPLDLSSIPQGGGAAPGGPLPPPPPANPSSTGAQVATLPPGNTPKDQFDLGYGYFQHKDYTQAAQTFTAFLHQYPSDRLTPEAEYWLGESLFQSQQYHDAAEAFLAVSTKYETTARAPDALLRLGQSLAALGEKEAACASLGEVLRKYPRASLSVKQGVDREQKRVHC